MTKHTKLHRIFLCGSLCLCHSGCGKEEQLATMYLCSDTQEVNLKDEDGNSITVPRGTAIQMSDQETEEDNTVLIYLDERKLIVSKDMLVENRDDCVRESLLYVNETVPAFESEDGFTFSEFVTYGQEVEIIGHSELLADGSVEWYQTPSGYVYADHLSFTPIMDTMDYGAVHRDRNDLYGGGDAKDLDYTPHAKMDPVKAGVPEKISAIYLNGAAVSSIDSYIDAAVNGNVNAFVIDIKDADMIAVNAETMQKYSPSSYQRAINTMDDYCTAVQKANDAGIYTIGRITVFKDTWYASDHPEYAIISSEDGGLFELGGALWPSAYSHDVWQYNAELAVEMAQKAGFDEIQFDYVRFPESVDWYYDYLHAIDLRNTENISRGQAIQQFLLYASEILHRHNILISADVFGETSNAYVTAYGQYWPAISNVTDAICAMPYPDHFSIHDYGIEQAVWEVPQLLLTYWGEHVALRQQETTTPARVVTYIQGYDSLRPPYVIYDREKIDEQIQGLKDGGIYDGHIIWNSSSDLSRYISYTQ